MDNPLDYPPDVDAPHTWCNFLTPEGRVWQTLHTSDDWASCFFIQVDSRGALTLFFKRIAPVTFTFLGGFREGLEKTEEWFARYGVDIPGWAEWIRRYGVMAREDGVQPDHEAVPDSIVIGGPWSPFYDYIERFYATQSAPDPN